MWHRYSNPLASTLRPVRNFVLNLPFLADFYTCINPYKIPANPIGISDFRRILMATLHRSNILIMHILLSTLS